MGYFGLVIGVDDIKIENGDCKFIFFIFILKVLSELIKFRF